MGSADSSDGSKDLLFEFPIDSAGLNIFSLVIFGSLVFGGFLLGLLFLGPLIWDWRVWTVALIAISLLFFFMAIRTLQSGPRILIMHDWMMVEGREFDPRSVRWVTFHKVIDGNRPGLHYVIRFIFFDRRKREQQATIHVGMYPDDLNRMMENLASVLPWAEVVPQKSEWHWY